MTLKLSHFTEPQILKLDWIVPNSVKAQMTTRIGGYSQAPYAGFNLGDHVGDNPVAVAANRNWLRQMLPSEPVWLEQVHGHQAVFVDATSNQKKPCADAVWTNQSGVVCAVLTADCLPLLVCNRKGTTVAAIHAGWRGLAAGVIEACLSQLGESMEELIIWLGPAIGPHAFEVTGEVRKAFIDLVPEAAIAFQQLSTIEDKWLADLYQLARQRLIALGICPDAIYGGNRCSFTEQDIFFSYRRDQITGRMASLIWLSLP